LNPNPTRLKRQTAREFLELQRLMARAVMRTLDSKGGMRSKWADGRAMKKVAAEFIKPNDRLSSFERLEIYNRQYWLRLKDCFYDDYPGLRALLGQGRFEKLTVAYLAAHPSQSFTLRNLGRRLVSFLEAQPRWIAPDPQVALDMARLEWAHIEAFDSASKPVLTVDALLESDPSRLRLNLQPHISLLDLHYPVDKFLVDVQHEPGLRGEASNAMKLRRRRWRNQLKRRLKPETIHLAVHRYQGSVYYKRLDAAQFRLLGALRGGVHFAEACAELAVSRAGDAELQIQVRDWFANWASLGWFCEPDEGRMAGSGTEERRGGNTAP
jgi:hypothetical protein